MMIKIYKKAILPRGFKANGVACGIKKSGKPDLALLYSELPARAAGLFTTNTFAAAPVIFDKRSLKKEEYFTGIVANSGNANAFTGAGGIASSALVADKVKRALKVESKSGVLVASTGIIGRPLPVKKIISAIPSLVQGLNPKGINKAARAILTTDTFSKEITVQCKIGASPVTICGIAKGAGMIAPDMATMLCFLLTDAHISSGALRKALKEAVAESFNSITVDGCMSTNDSVLILANSAAGNPLINSGSHLKLFSVCLKEACLVLAKAIVRDAEGASKFITIHVRGARTKDDAKKIALFIAGSALFKTAMYGENPNFGRIIAAVGASGAGVFHEDLKKIRVSPLHKRNIEVTLTLNHGKASGTIYTSDLTPEYIKINAEYN